MKVGIKEPFLMNAPKGLPSKLLKRLIREGRSPKQAFKEGWKQYKRGIKNPLASVSGDLMIVNKYKKKRGGIKMRKKRSSRRKRSYRRNSMSLSNPISLNLNRYRKRRGMRRSYSRNPALALPLVGRVDIPSTKEILGGAVGLIAVKLVPSMIFPIDWQVGVKRIASQGLTILGSTLIANKVLGKTFGKAVLFGGIISMASELVGQILTKVGVPVGLYLQPQDMAYYMTEKEQTI